MSAPSPVESTDATHVRSEADRLAAGGNGVEAIELLSGWNRRHRDPAVEGRLVELRHESFPQVAAASHVDRWPVEGGGSDQEHPPELPVVEPPALSAQAVRAAISQHGAVLVPGLLDSGRVQAFTAGIDEVLAIRDSNRDRPFAPHPPWFVGLPLPPEEAQSLGRPWIAAAGGFLACDSPRLLELLFTTYEDLGVRDVLADYLGERPILSANKCTFRRVSTDAQGDWHQDGAFLGSGIRALNVWIALSPCGIDAPGLDLVPRRFETVQETGTGGAIFDWAVGPEVVGTLSQQSGVLRPHFAAGDALLFDDLYLHRTAISTAMSEPRYAIESWFFGATDYPAGQVPLVW